MNNRSRWSLALLTVVVAMSGCGTAEEPLETATKSPLVLLNAPFYDGPGYGGATQYTLNGVTSHICPWNDYTFGVMVGAHLGDNVFKCQPAEYQQFTGLFMDGPDSPSHSITTFPGQTNFHWCGPNAVMMGYNHDRNDLICLATPVNGLVTGLGTQDSYPMHVCTNIHDQTGQTAMVGIDTNNVFACTDS